jgi:hypothetical protein
MWEREESKEVTARPGIVHRFPTITPAHGDLIDDTFQGSFVLSIPQVGSTLVVFARGSWFDLGEVIGCECEGDYRRTFRVKVKGAMFDLSVQLPPGV